MLTLGILQGWYDFNVTSFFTNSSVNTRQESVTFFSFLHPSLTNSLCTKEAMPWFTQNFWKAKIQGIDNLDTWQTPDPALPPCCITQYASYLLQNYEVFVPLLWTVFYYLFFLSTALLHNNSWALACAQSCYKTFLLVWAVPGWLLCYCVVGPLTGEENTQRNLRWWLVCPDFRKERKSPFHSTEAISPILLFWDSIARMQNSVGICGSSHSHKNYSRKHCVNRYSQG